MNNDEPARVSSWQEFGFSEEWMPDGEWVGQRVTDAMRRMRVEWAGMNLPSEPFQMILRVECQVRRRTPVVWRAPRLPG